jgi:hypothetical protein
MYITSHGRPDTISTPALLQGLPCMVVVHSDDQADAYFKAGRVFSVHVSGAEPGMCGKANQQNWILDNLVQPGEWVAMLNDNITGITALPYPQHCSSKIDQAARTGKEWRAMYRTACTPATFARICDEMAKYADTIGADFCGFAACENYFFRQARWRERAVVIGNAFLIKNTGARFALHQDDIHMYAVQMLRRGTTLTDMYTHIEQEHYTAGGFGAYAKRVPVLLRESKHLHDTYAGLFAYMQQSHVPGYVPNTHLKRNLRSVGQVERWRESMRSAVHFAGTREAV